MYVMGVVAYFAIGACFAQHQWRETDRCAGHHVDTLERFVLSAFWFFSWPILILAFG